MTVDHHSPIRFSDITFAQEDGSFSRDDGTSLELRPQSFEVLTILARNAGDIVSKDTLIANVWQGLNVTDDSLVQCVSDIRRIIGPDGHNIVKTIPKKGYRLVPNKNAETVIAPKPQGRTAIWVALSMAVVLASGLWWSRTPSQNPDENDVLKAEFAMYRGPSIAVLPFEDLTGDARWERLGRGLTTDVTAELARNKWLFVIAPETANALIGDDPVAIGQSLKVRFVTSGTIQAEGSALRIAARMTDAESGKVLWAENWTKPAKSVFAIQDELMERIGSTLTSAWTGEIGKADLIKAKTKPTEDLTAYEHYLIGAGLKQTFEKKDLEAAIEHFEKAIEIDPSFARAWAMMSFSRNIYRNYVQGRDKIDEIQAKATQDGERAYELSPNDPHVLIRMSSVRAENNRIDEIAPFLLKAIETAPSDADILATAAWIGSVNNIIIGDPVANARRAMELNPNHPDWYWISLGNAAHYTGDEDLALEAYRNAPETPDSKFMMAVVEIYRGNIEEARRIAQELEEIAPGYTIENQFHTAMELPESQEEIKATQLAGIPLNDEEYRLLNPK